MLPVSVIHQWFTSRAWSDCIEPCSGLWNWTRSLSRTGIHFGGKRSGKAA
jgi:hypothetical protein